MKFIEITSRKFIFEDATRNGGASNYKYRWLQTYKRFKILSYLEFEYRKSHTIKGDIRLELTCATKSSILHLHPQLLSQDSQHFTLTLAVLPGAALPHPKRGTAAVRHCHTWAATLPRLKWPLGLRGIYTFSLPPQCLSGALHSFSSSKNRRE